MNFNVDLRGPEGAKKTVGCWAESAQEAFEQIENEYPDYDPISAIPFLTERICMGGNCDE